ncbi:unnamed protein product [Caenorhabditis angaria]|uniref:Uncharacterized protein n=1 Tax=Caenorhabditis angaria TaxID=860376 RepID=A0A9P1IVF4_9PELO|nr:unnamed protein product [Caenorhabditis angaria]
MDQILFLSMSSAKNIILIVYNIVFAIIIAISMITCVVARIEKDKPCSKSSAVSGSQSATHTTTKSPVPTSDNKNVKNKEEKKSSKKMFKSSKKILSYKKVEEKEKNETGDGTGTDGGDGMMYDEDGNVTGMKHEQTVRIEMVDDASKTRSTRSMLPNNNNIDTTGLLLYEVDEKGEKQSVMETARKSVKENKPQKSLNLDPTQEDVHGSELAN